MKIELLNRRHWIAKIDLKLQWIAEYRLRQDKEFIDTWRTIGFRSRTGKMPRHGESVVTMKTGYMQYPCQDYWSTMNTLTTLRSALATENTGAVYVNDDELRMMEV